MGLLDNVFNSEGGRLGLGLLAAGSARSDGAGAGQRLMEAIGSVDQWKQQQALAKRQAMQDQFMQFQMEQAKAQAAKQAQQEAEAARVSSLIPSLFKKPSAGAPALNVDSLLPPELRAGTPTVGAVSPSAGGFDLEKALALKLPPKLIEEYAKLNDIGKQEVARTIKGVGADGKEYEYQVDKFGNKIGEGFGQWKAPILNDGGGQTNVLDPYNPLKPLGAIPKTMTFADKNAAARLTLDRQNQDKPQWIESLGGFVDPRQRVVRPAIDAQGNPIQSSKPMSDVQAKALQFGSRMQEADRLLNGLAKAGTDQPGVIKRTAESVPWVGNGLGVMANATQSDAQQSVEQAQRDFVNAVLRRESGAAISPTEFDSAKKQYFPQPFDSEAVKQQKARNRALAIQGVLAEVPGQNRNMLQTNQPQNNADPLGLFTR